MQKYSPALRCAVGMLLMSASAKTCTALAGRITTAILLAAAASAGAQQTYPAKPIRIISPYPAGGTTDILARMVGAKLTESWGQQVLVDNRPGGNTIIGSEAMVKSPPDGYTLLSILTSHVIVPNLAPTPYDAVKDFAAVATIASTQLVLVVHPSVPVRNLQELKVLAMPDIRERLLSQGMNPFVSTSNQFAALIKADLAKFTRVIKTANIKLEQ